MQHKQKPVKNLDELALLLLEKQADFNNGEISAGDLKANAMTSSVVFNIYKFKWQKNQVEGITENIAFLQSEYATKDLPPAEKGLKSEFFEKEKELIS